MSPDPGASHVTISPTSSLSPPPMYNEEPRATGSGPDLPQRPPRTHRFHRHTSQHRSRRSRSHRSPPTNAEPTANSTDSCQVTLSCDSFPTESPSTTAVDFSNSAEMCGNAHHVALQRYYEQYQMHYALQQQRYSGGGALRSTPSSEQVFPLHQAQQQQQPSDKSPFLMIKILLFFMLIIDFLLSTIGLAVIIILAKNYWANIAVEQSLNSTALPYPATGTSSEPPVTINVLPNPVLLEIQKLNSSLFDSQQTVDSEWSLVLPLLPPFFLNLFLTVLGMLGVFFDLFSFSMAFAVLKLIASLCYPSMASSAAVSAIATAFSGNGSSNASGVLVNTHHLAVTGLPFISTPNSTMPNELLYSRTQFVMAQVHPVLNLSFVSPLAQPPPIASKLVTTGQSLSPVITPSVSTASRMPVSTLDPLILPSDFDEPIVKLKRSSMSNDVLGETTTNSVNGDEDLVSSSVESTSPTTNLDTTTTTANENTLPYYQLSGNRSKWNTNIPNRRSKTLKEKYTKKMTAKQKVLASRLKAANYSYHFQLPRAATEHSVDGQRIVLHKDAHLSSIKYHHRVWDALLVTFEVIFAVAFAINMLTSANTNSSTNGNGQDDGEEGGSAQLYRIEPDASAVSTTNNETSHPSSGSTPRVTPRRSPSRGRHSHHRHRHGTTRSMSSTLPYIPVANALDAYYFARYHLPAPPPPYFCPLASRQASSTSSSVTSTSGGRFSAQTSARRALNAWRRRVTPTSWLSTNQQRTANQNQSAPRAHSEPLQSSSDIALELPPSYDQIGRDRPIILVDGPLPRFPPRSRSSQARSNSPLQTSSLLPIREIETPTFEESTEGSKEDSRQPSPTQQQQNNTNDKTETVTQV